jgi:hypothetical protein
MQFLKLLRTVPKEVRWLAIIAMAALLLKLLLLNKLPAPSQVIYDLGPIVDNILYSVLASCIFYFFVVHLKEELVNPAVLDEPLPDLFNFDMKIFRHCALFRSATKVIYAGLS